MSEHNERVTVLRNIVANWTGGLVAAAVAFLLTPFVIDCLRDPEYGNEAYGAWTFIVSFASYIGLVDLGLFQSIIQYFTRSYAQDQLERCNRVVSTAAAIVTLGSAAAFLIAVVAAYSLPQWLGVRGLEVGEVRLAFLLAAFGAAATVPLEVFRAVVVARQSFHTMNLALVASRLLSALAIWWALSSGFGLVGLAVATVGTTLLGGAAQIWLAYHLVPSLRVRVGDVDRKTARELLHYAKWMFGSRLSNIYLADVDLIIVPLLFGAEAAAVYGLSFTLVRLAKLPIQGFADVLGPTVVEADTKGHEWRLRSILLDSSRIGLLLGGIFTVGFVFWAEDFIFQWIGDPSFLWEAEFASAATILAIVSLDRVFLRGMTGPGHVLVGMRRVRELSLIKISQGLIGLVAAILAGKFIGLLAVPAALVLTSLAGHLTMTVLACRLSRTPLPFFVGSAVMPPVLVMAIMAAASWAIAAALPISGWAGLGLKVTLSGLAGVVPGALISLTASERAAFVEAARRILAKVGLLKTTP